MEETARRGSDVRPEALAAAQGAPPREGLDWLGRPPERRLGWLARGLMAVAGFGLYRVASIQVRIEGRERFPASGCLVAAALHRGWIDPLIAVRALPSEPRPWFIGSGPSTFTSRWREALLRQVGGILPVWRGGLDPDVHVEAARAVVEVGCPFVVFIEGSVAGAPDRVHRVRAGVGLLAMRLPETPILPLAIAGSDDLYRGKRIAARALEPVTARTLAGPESAVTWPTPGSRDEIRLARLITDRLAARLQDAVDELYPGTVDPPERARRWRWLRRLV